MAAPTNRIEKKIHLRAPRSRVWNALTKSREFGAWFGVDVKDEFSPGAKARGPIKHPDYAHLTWEVTIDRIEPERFFSWKWHPYAVDPNHDYSSEPFTLVEFTLEEDDGGTLLTVVESGFDEIPLARRAEAYRSNDGGWQEQLENIAKYVHTNK